MSIPKLFLLDIGGKELLRFEAMLDLLKCGVSELMEVAGNDTRVNVRVVNVVFNHNIQDLVFKIINN